MTDWSKFKVTELKDECKARDIPLTGIKLKQQYIEKLEEYEAELAKNIEEKSVQKETRQDDGEAAAPDGKQSPLDEEEPGHQATLEAVEVANHDKHESGIVDSDRPATLRKEVAQATEESETPPAIFVAEESSLAQENDVFVPEPRANGDKVTENDRNGETPAGHPAESSISDNMDVDLEQQPKQAIDEPSPPQMPDESRSNTSTDRSINDSKNSAPIASKEVVEDLRKRKRRSTSPMPTSVDVALKKTKAEDGSAIVSVREGSALDQVQAATDAARALRSPDGLEQSERAPLPPDQSSLNTMAADVLPTKPSEEAEDNAMAKHPSQNPDHIQTRPDRHQSPSPMDQESTLPAIHPATKSLYIRNFKRPLHIPSLRNHIQNLARGTNSVTDTDPVTTFYLDSIRTHAFVGFDTISAAARVRSSLHDTRYPDEVLREPLFVDFIPDDKLQNWIDQESGQGGSGRRSSTMGQRYEVVYEEGPNGVEAIHQEWNGKSSINRPQIQPSRSSHSQQTPIELTNPSPTVTVPVHPDRARLIPPPINPQDRPDRKSRPQQHSQRLPSRQNTLNYDDDTNNPQSSPPKPKPQSSGTGFQALDTLFSSTTTKPKLYYKPASSTVVDDRFDLIKDLRSGHNEMGRSGDEGMKRYTFETYRGREEWVDKGPEFGFGRRGVERLIGGSSGFPVRGGMRRTFRGGGGGFVGAGNGGIGRGDVWRR